MVYKPFSVVVTKMFPFVDTPLYKPRPALIISSEDYCVSHSAYICLMVTTAKDYRTDDIQITNLSLAGLHHESKIRFKFASIDIMQIEKQLGALDDISMQCVQKNLLNSLAFQGATHEHSN